MNMRTAFDFFVDTDNGGGVRSDDPAFAVSFGHQSLITYVDAEHDVRLGASYRGSKVKIIIEDLAAALGGGADAPPDDLRSVMDRIRAAGDWSRRDVRFEHLRRPASRTGADQSGS